MLTVYSKGGKKGGKDAFLGRAVVPLLELRGQAARPRWFRLEAKPGKELPNEDAISRGEIQAKFELRTDSSCAPPSAAPLQASASQK